MKFDTSTQHLPLDLQETGDARRRRRISQLMSTVASSFLFLVVMPGAPSSDALCS